MGLLAMAGSLPNLLFGLLQVYGWIEPAADQY
jgi:hypothetical protein